MMMETAKKKEGKVKLRLQWFQEMVKEAEDRKKNRVSIDIIRGILGATQHDAAQKHISQVKHEPGMYEDECGIDTPTHTIFTHIHISPFSL